MKGLFDLLSDKRRQDFADESPDFGMESDDVPETLEAPHGFEMMLKKKRKNALLKKMLVDDGYSDLAKMINIKEY